MNKEEAIRTLQDIQTALIDPYEHTDYDIQRVQYIIDWIDTFIITYSIKLILFISIIHLLGIGLQSIP